jgi:hypothetical protein
VDGRWSGLDGDSDALQPPEKVLLQDTLLQGAQAHAPLYYQPTSGRSRESIVFVSCDAKSRGSGDASSGEAEAPARPERDARVARLVGRQAGRQAWGTTETGRER